MPKDSAINAEVLLRYLALVRYLESELGYGQYLVTLHGRRPVKVSKVAQAEVLETFDLT
jgi:hypothetical protein